MWIPVVKEGQTWLYWIHFFGLIFSRWPMQKSSSPQRFKPKTCILSGKCYPWTYPAESKERQQLKHLNFGETEMTKVL